MASLRSRHIRCAHCNKKVKVAPQRTHPEVLQQQLQAARLRQQRARHAGVVRGPATSDDVEFLQDAGLVPRDQPPPKPRGKR